MATRIKLRRDTSANWILTNPILAQGETGFETDTRAMKLGDGVTKWKDLKYAVTGDLKVTGPVIHGDKTVGLSSGMGDQSNWVMTIHTNSGDFADPTDGFVTSVAYDSKGNVFSTGGYSQPGGYPGMFLIKTDTNGQVIFHNYYSEYYAFGYAMTVDKNDDVIFVMGEYDPSSADTVLVKVSGEDGTIMWQKYLADTDPYSNDVAICVDIDPTSNNIIIAGTTATSSNYDFWVGKFSGASGNTIWQKQYDNNSCTDAASGLAVDSNGDIGVCGSSYGPGNILPVFKLSGADGSVMWQKQIVNATMDNANVWMEGECYSADMCVDSNNDFYFNLTGIWCEPFTVSGVHKVRGSDGKILWGKVVSYPSFFNGSSSITCDDENNVYASSVLWTYRQQNQDESNDRWYNVITKFNSTGSKIWCKALIREQGGNWDRQNEVFYTGPGSPICFGQTVSVKDDYVLLGGQMVTLYPYNDGFSGNSWYLYPFIAQVDRIGTDFNSDGWHFIDEKFPIFDITLITDDGAYLNDLTEGTPDIVVSLGDVSFESNTDTVQLSYYNRSRVKTLTLEGSKVMLPENGTLEFSRETKGYITAVGGFDGTEGGNTEGNVWMNGTVNDSSGNTFSAGGQYSYWDGTWQTIPIVYKTDKDGKLLWQAGNILDQNYGTADMYGIAYNAENNTVIAVSTDGELDGHEGFNIYTLNADTGSMMEDIIHVRPGENDNDLFPTVVKTMSDGTPVVAGYISGATDEFADVTNGGAGLPGSGWDTLVMLKSKFVREGATTEYPKEDGSWYLGGTQINHVNHYGDDEAFTTGITYTGTLGSGATFNVTVSGGAWTDIAIVSGGSGYKPGQKVKILGTSLGGVTPTNDLYLFVDTVDGSGAITDITGDKVYDSIPADGGPYTAVASVAVAGSGLTGWVQVDPVTNTYTFNKNSGGTNYGVGDTLKIVGSDLGGANVTNDLIITVTAISGTGNGYGGITDFTVAGTAQDTNIKLHASGTDYSQADTYNIFHELSNEGFIWTPNWHKSFGSTENYSYDTFYGAAIDSQDNVIVSGYSEYTGLGSQTTWYNSDNQTGIISKFSDAGENLWTVSIDGSEGASTVWAVDTDADDNIYSVMCNNNNEDLYVTKLNSAGEYVWQLNINMWNSSNTWSIAVTDNGDMIVAGKGYINYFDNDRIDYNDNIIITKFDKDGNLLFSRALWSTNGVRTCYHDYNSNQVSINGDRFSFAAYSYDPGNDYYQGITISLPLDGTGLGDYGDFHYEEIELEVNNRFETNSAGGHAIVTPITMSTREHTFVNAPYTGEDYWRNVTVYGKRPAEIQTVREPDGADITGVAKIVFEDGTEQTSSAQGLTQVKMSQVNGGGSDSEYWVRPADNGKHIYMTRYNCTIVIPRRDMVELPIGFAFTIITENNECGVYSWDYDEDIYGSGFDGTSDGSWTIPRYTMCTLVKLEDGRWMIAGPGISTGWW